MIKTLFLQLKYSLLISDHCGEKSNAQCVVLEISDSPVLGCHLMHTRNLTHTRNLQSCAATQLSVPSPCLSALCALSSLGISIPSFGTTVHDTVWGSFVCSIIVTVSFCLGGRGRHIARFSYLCGGKRMSAYQTTHLQAWWWLFVCYLHIILFCSPGKSIRKKTSTCRFKENDTGDRPGSLLQSTQLPPCNPETLAPEACDNDSRVVQGLPALTVSFVEAAASVSICVGEEGNSGLK